MKYKVVGTFEKIKVSELFKVCYLKTYYTQLYKTLDKYVKSKQPVLFNFDF